MYCVHYNLYCLPPFRWTFPENCFGQYFHPHSRVVQARCGTWTVSWHTENNWVKPPKRYSQVSDRNGDSMVAKERQFTAQLAVISFRSKLTISGQSWNSHYDCCRTPITLVDDLNCIVAVFFIALCFYIKFDIWEKKKMLLNFVHRPSPLSSFDHICQSAWWKLEGGWEQSSILINSKLNSLPESVLSHFLHQW